MNTLSHYKLIEVSGTDANRFLQGQLSCDIDQVTPEHFSQALHCNLKGRIVSAFWIIAKADSYLLLIPKVLADIALENLNKYSVFSKVQFVDCTDQYTIFASKTHHHKLTLSAEHNCIASQKDYTLRFATALYLHIMSKDSSLVFNETTLTPQQWKIECIKNKIIHISDNTSGKLIPHRLGLHDTDAISFKKGCYTGQEVIARLHYKSTLKHQLQVFEIIGEATLHELDELKNDSVKCQIINIEPINATKHIALLITPLELNVNPHFTTDSGEVTLSKPA